MARRPLAPFNFQTVSKFSLKLKQLQGNSDQSNRDFENSMESLIFGLLKIDIISLIKSKAILSKNFHIQPSEVDMMPMWEYELYLKQLNELVEEENEKHKDIEQGQGKDMNKYKKMINNRSQPSMPKTPNFNMPKTPNMW